MGDGSRLLGSIRSCSFLSAMKGSDHMLACDETRLLKLCEASNMFDMHFNHPSHLET